MGSYITNLKKIVPAISEIQETKVSVFLCKHKNSSNLGMHALIELKIGTVIGHQKANIRTEFGDNPTEIHVVISDHSYKQRSIC